MKYNISYTAQAQRDLDEIWNYLVSECQAVSGAEHVVESIMSDVDQLENFAELGPPLSSIADVKSDFRFLVTGNHLTFYRVSGTEVYIDRVLYGRRDYLSCLFDDNEKLP